MQSTSRSVSQKSHLVPRILSRKFASGTRGSRGHGWLNKYRQGLGGRHLQGRYHNRDVNKRQSINDQVFGMNVNKQLAFLDLKVDDHKETKRVTIELASEALPQTCRNFVSLCSSSGGSQDEVEGTLSYQNTKVFKIEPKVGICMGDVTGGNDGLQGSCHPSTVTSKEAQGNPHTFEHESTVLSHCSKGMVSMLSTGMDKNDSRFMITTVDDAPHLDGKYVAFGRVQEGLDVLEDLVKGVYTKKGRPTVDIEVVNCGVVS